jgi:hypothetical protein
VNDSDVARELGAELQEALAQIAKAKQSLAVNDMAGLGQSMSFIDQWSARLLVWANEGRVRSHPALLALVDEAQTLIITLSAEHLRLCALLQEVRHQRAAGAAYRQAQRL